VRKRPLPVPTPVNSVGEPASKRERVLERNQREKTNRETGKTFFHRRERLAVQTMSNSHEPKFWTQGEHKKKKKMECRKQNLSSKNGGGG